MKKWIVQCGLVAAMLFIAGCQGTKDEGDTSGVPGAGPDGATKEVTVAVSEYPSWSTFLVMHERGLINKERGKLGTVEKKWGVDVVVKVADYPDCFTLYSQGNAQAVCITNMDILPLALTRKSTAVAPTSFSNGADACISADPAVKKVADLKGKTVRGLEKAVTQYLHERVVEIEGGDAKDFPFKQMDPGTAAQAMQTSQAGIDAIGVWNPFKLSTLRGRDGAHVVYDSTAIPEEIVDMLVVDTAFLESEGGEAAAACLVDAFYQLNVQLGGSLTGAAKESLSEDEQKAAVALGSEFSSLGLEDMLIVLKETKFYRTSEEGTKLFSSKKFQQETTPRVVSFCQKKKMTDKEPSIGWDDSTAQLNFSTKIMEKVANDK